MDLSILMDSDSSGGPLNKSYNEKSFQIHTVEHDR